MMEEVVIEMSKKFESIGPWMLSSHTPRRNNKSHVRKDYLENGQTNKMSNGKKVNANIEKTSKGSRFVDLGDENILDNEKEEILGLNNMDQDRENTSESERMG